MYSEEIKSEDPNQIDLMPERIEVTVAHLWKKKDMSQVKDFKEIEITNDWTYSTPYKGTIHKLSNEVERIKLTTGLDLSENIEANPKEITLIKDESLEIPVERLTPANPILNYVEVPFYDDELDDNGHMSTFVRFRNMNDCFYALVRFYV